MGREDKQAVREERKTAAKVDAALEACEDWPASWPDRDAMTGPNMKDVG
jgi:hypothetical protein